MTATKQGSGPTNISPLFNLCVMTFALKDHGAVSPTDAMLAWKTLSYRGSIGALINLTS